ncbi:MAG TPA: MFS transporter [Abditibacteriaceae bacterium]|nr:MFS transporter [Abditibacteriaceae bacterium]
MSTSSQPPQPDEDSSLQSAARNGLVNAPRPARPNGQTSQHATPERLPVDDVRVSMTRVITAWGFGAAFTNLTAGAIYVAFVRKLGASDFIFGVLAGALPLMSFLQVLGARLVERTGRRKLQMMVSGTAARLLWIVAAFAPLTAQLYPRLIASHQVLPVVVGCLLLSGACQAFNSPAFFSWMADLVPGRVRATFLARRMQVGTVIALVTSIAGGLIADYYPNLTVYSVILALAGLAGVIDIVLFVGVREPPHSAAVSRGLDSSRMPPFWSSLREPLREPSIRTFLLFISIIMFSAGLLGPFMWLHAFENLNLSKTVTGLILNVAPYLGVAWSSRFWGDVVKRHGNRPVMRLGSASLVLVPLYWLSVRPGATGMSESWDTLFVMTLVVSTLSTGLEITNQNLLMGLSPHIPRATLTALFSIAAGLSFAAATWIGGAVAQWLRAIDFRYEVFGAEFINYHVLFLGALALRLFSATFIAPRLHEPTATATIETVKEIVPDLIDSFAARLSRPVGARED